MLRRSTDVDGGLHTYHPGQEELQLLLLPVALGPLQLLLDHLQTDGLRSAFAGRARERQWPAPLTSLSLSLMSLMNL